MTELDKILRLVDEGILGSESCPEERYWHWPVKEPKELPEEFRENYEMYGEIRWYGRS